jgi:hypothetical protein
MELKRTTAVRLGCRESAVGKCWRIVVVNDHNLCYSNCWGSEYRGRYPVRVFQVRNAHQALRGL